MSRTSGGVRPVPPGVEAEPSPGGQQWWRHHALLVLGSIALLAAMQAFYWSHTVDDAYITFRYAENFVRGLGLVFNPGERVEGYTNFLWTLALSAGFAAGFDTRALSKVLGAAAGVGLLWIASRYVHRLDGAVRVRALAIALPILATSPALAAWSVAGLETTLFAFLFNGAILRFLREQDEARPIPWSALLIALASLTRPEGAILVPLIGTALLWRWWRGEIGWPVLVTWVAMLAAVTVPYMAWRVGYYGYWLPNTFYVKTGRGIVQFLGGVLYLVSTLQKHGGLLFWLLAFLPAAWGTNRKAGVQLALVLIGWTAYMVYKGHDVLTLFRFAVPVLPIVYALSAVVVARLISLRSLDYVQSQLCRVLAAILVLGTMGMNLVVAYLSRDERIQLREYQVQLLLDGRGFEPVARRLMEIGPPGATIALIDAGVIPYMTGWYTIDRYGLVDEHIAHGPPKGPLGEKFDERYVLAQRPTFIQTKVSAAAARLPRVTGGWAGDPELFAQPEFTRDYERLQDPVLDGFYVRRDAPLKTALMR